MFLKYVFILTVVFTCGNPVPHNYIQINKFDAGNNDNYLKVNNVKTLKQILIENLIATSDNLKYILNLERTDDIENDDIDTSATFDDKVPSLDNSMKYKRQVMPGSGNSQVVLGTFQAMMRPMSVGDMPGLGSIGGQSQSEDVNQDNTEAKTND